MWHDFTPQAGLLAAADSAVTQAAWFHQEGDRLIRIIGKRQYR
jgi:hypothetical protein